MWSEIKIVTNGRWRQIDEGEWLVLGGVHGRLGGQWGDLGGVFGARVNSLALCYFRGSF